jgi:hypothetical protein
MIFQFYEILCYLEIYDSQKIKVTYTWKEVDIIEMSHPCFNIHL